MAGGKASSRWCVRRLFSSPRNFQPERRRSPWRRGRLWTMKLTYRMRGLLQMAAYVVVGAGAWLLYLRGEEDRLEKAEKYNRTHPAEMAMVQDNNARISAILKQASETSDNIAAKPWPWWK